MRDSGRLACCAPEDRSEAVPSRALRSGGMIGTDFPAASCGIGHAFSAGALLSESLLDTPSLRAETVLLARDCGGLNMGRRPITATDKAGILQIPTENRDLDSDARWEGLKLRLVDVEGREASGGI